MAGRLALGTLIRYGLTFRIQVLSVVGDDNADDDDDEYDDDYDDHDDHDVEQGRSLPRAVSLVRCSILGLYSLSSLSS